MHCTNIISAGMYKTKQGTVVKTLTPKKVCNKKSIQKHN